MVWNCSRIALPLIALVIAACGEKSSVDGENNESQNSDTLPAVNVTSLHALADFPVGVAVPAGNNANSLLMSSQRQSIVESHFDSLTAENIMKPVALHPAENTYFYDDADALIAYADAHGMIMHGHTLIWHNGIPDWMQNFVGDADAWQTMMESHISNVAAYFDDKVVSWDVVNEVFNDDGTYRSTIWYDNIGPEYIELAFVAARAADADADLYYNDYSISGITTKLNAVLAMVEDFQDRDIPIDGVGFQMHVNLTWPDIDRIKQSFTAVVDLGIKVRISELDISVNNAETLTMLTTAVEQQQADRYKTIVQAYMESVPQNLRGGISMWGIVDSDSWIPWFYDRPDWPLLFGSDFQPKQAVQGFADALTGE